MTPSPYIVLSEQDKKRIISHFTSLKDEYATDFSGYTILNKCLEAIEQDRLNKADLIELKGIKNGLSLVKMIIKDAYGHDMSEYVDEL
jgi:hypothetical protein